MPTSPYTTNPFDPEKNRFAGVTAESGQQLQAPQQPLAPEEDSFQLQPPPSAAAPVTGTTGDRPPTSVQAPQVPQTAPASTVIGQTGAAPLSQLPALAPPGTTGTTGKYQQPATPYDLSNVMYGYNWNPGRNGQLEHWNKTTGEVMKNPWLDPEWRKQYQLQGLDADQQAMYEWDPNHGDPEQGYGWWKVPESASETHTLLPSGAWTPTNSPNPNQPYLNPPTYGNQRSSTGGMGGAGGNDLDTFMSNTGGRPYWPGTPGSTGMQQQNPGQNYQPGTSGPGANNTPSNTQNPSRTGVVGGGGQPWFSNLWSMINTDPQYGEVFSSRTPADAAMTNEMVSRSNIRAPQYNFGPVDPQAGASDVLSGMLAGRAAQMPGELNYGGVSPNMPGESAGLDAQSAGLASNMLANPSRYDNDMFNQLLQTTMRDLDQRQDRDRTNILRDSNKRLGPNSGQLTNEYIDLDAEYDFNRHRMATDLLDRAAQTQASDKLAAIGAGRGVSGDIFGRDLTMRDELRGERGFERDTDIYNQQAAGTAQDRLASVASQLYGQEAGRRGEARTERDFGFNQQRAGFNDTLAANSAQMAAQNQLFGQDASMRGEARTERDFDRTARADRLNEFANYGNIDRQLGRDAMDDYFREWSSEIAGNESLARIDQGAFSNNLALAMLIAQLQATGNPDIDASDLPPAVTGQSGASPPGYTGGVTGQHSGTAVPRR